MNFSHHITTSHHIKKLKSIDLISFLIFLWSVLRFFSACILSADNSSDGGDVNGEAEGDDGVSPKNTERQARFKQRRIDF